MKDHQRDKGHCYCKDCDLCFEDAATLLHHRCTKLRPSEFRCIDCRRDFSSEQALVQHLASKKNHQPLKSAIEPSADGFFHCDKCDRRFAQRYALEQHQASNVHKPLSNLRCIASAKCTKHFTSPSALLGHLESGACSSRLNKDLLDTLILEHDTENIITFGVQEMLLPGKAANDSEEIIGLSPKCLRASIEESDTDSGGLGALLKASDVPEWYPSAAENEPGKRIDGKLSCPLCPAGSKGFRTRQAFQEHLGSPAHAPKIFHCPLDLLPVAQARVPLKAFSTLSGLTSHIESNACEGGRRMLEAAADFIEEKLQDLGWAQIKLLN
ncbi:MAG: hypothetical protein Q9220_002401 [cf. Caloplaca sp. 1 TL-2023]